MKKKQKRAQDKRAPRGMKGAGRGLVSVYRCYCCWVKPRKRLMRICEGLGGKGERVVALGDGKGGEGCGKGRNACRWIGWGRLERVPL